MDVSIFGLGYVGAVTSACLAEAGHQVMGVDVQQAKVDAFNQGRSPIVEPGLDDLLRAAVSDKRLRASTGTSEAVAATAVSIIAVGTPSLPTGEIKMDFIRNVCQEIAEELTRSGKHHTVIFRSTMLPGSTRQMVADYFAALCQSGQVRVFYCPEFLREGMAVSDFRDPSLVVLGTMDGHAADDAAVLQLIGGKPSVMTWQGAEMVKYACNYFHALKVGFANEIGRLCKLIGEDGQRVMDVLCTDTRLNISTHYLKPGTPFGGSCLPKDLRALAAYARQEEVRLPLLENTLLSNEAHLDLILSLVESKKQKRVGLLGLAFKADTDDLRGSPMVHVAEELLKRGYELSIYDPQLNLARLLGANASEIQQRIPHLTDLLKSSPGAVVEGSDVIIAAHRCARADELATVTRPDQWVIDINGWSELKLLNWKYEGICW